MSVTEEIEELLEVGGVEVTTKDTRVEQIVKDTIPGRSNDEIISLLNESGPVMSRVISNLNNWFELLEFHAFNDGTIGATFRYRWTIKRWAEQDMDMWLVDRGWEDLPHLKADSRDHLPNELEARYRKEFRGRMVYANFYVRITDDVFEALNESRTMERRSRQKDKAEEILEMKRGM